MPTNSDISHESLSCKPHITSKQELTALCEVGDPTTGAVLRSTFSFINANDTAWFGQVSGVRKDDLTIEDVKRNLREIPDDIVYPEATPGVITLADGNDTERYYIKRPKLLCLDCPEEAKLLPKLLVGETYVLEVLKNPGHRNLAQYHGCVVKRDRIVGIALEKYDMILQDRFDNDLGEFDIASCMNGIRAGVEHLHSLGFAHNDLNPTNIALDQHDQPVIIDFGSCRRFGDPLLSGGTPGWVDENYTTSAQKHDVSALEKLQSWLLEQESNRAKP